MPVNLDNHPPYHTPPADAVYDPELHGDDQAPPPSPVLAFLAAVGAAAIIVGGGYAIQQWFSTATSTCC